MKFSSITMLVTLLGGILVGTARAESPSLTAGYDSFKQSGDYLPFALDNLWILLAAALVLIMHLGFGTLEAGLTQRKNTVNILFKNVFIVSMGLVTYYLWGFAAHYPGQWWDADAQALAADTNWNGFFALGKLAGFSPDDYTANMTASYGDYTYWTDFIFQGMFAATAATIVSGAVAERIKIYSFMILATLLVTFAYPIAGSWHWGTGFLAKVGFHDFAGSTMVHAFGGFSALAAVIILGPRRGKYLKSGTRPILPSSLPLATIGVFLLWFGWYGFNGGSVLNTDAASLSLVFVTTSIAAASGALASMLTSIITLKKPDLSMALNGVLGGLVGITAGADVISVPMALVTGAIAGVIVVLSILGFDKLKLDDPVGAISVHGICGVWGTLAVALFSDAAGISAQLIGILAVCGFAFLFALLVMLALKFTLGIRVDPELEEEGLDIEEHGSPAYSEL